MVKVQEEPNNTIGTHLSGKLQTQRAGNTQHMPYNSVTGEFHFEKPRRKYPKQAARVTAGRRVPRAMRVRVAGFFPEDL